MKTLMILLTCTLATSAFARGGSSSVGVGNPASKLCIKLGGELEQKNSPQGQYDNCVIEEWKLYTAMSKKNLVKPIHCPVNMGCMPNPASKNCADIGGEFREVDERGGAVGMCVIEEWKLWKVFNK